MPTATSPPELRDLKREIKTLSDDEPKLKDDELFVWWFLRAYVTEKRDAARDALTGPSGEKGLDAVFIDDSRRLVTLVQGKYRDAVGKTSEDRDKVIGFARLARALAGGSDDFETFTEKLEGNARTRVTEARERILRRKFRLNLHYVTLGRFTKPVAAEAKRLVRSVEIPAGVKPRLGLIDGPAVMQMMSDYLDGVAPPVPLLELAVQGSAADQFDPASQIESWIFAMRGDDVGRLLDQAGQRLFGRNIRGFLGSSRINAEIELTLRKRPQAFWYLNNGITIVCDRAELEKAGGSEVLSVSNPQVINGQQTTRVLNQVGKQGSKAKVFVRVIRVPRHPDAAEWADYLAMISRVVAATNSQNSIKPSDLRSNDRLQVTLQRDLEKLGYFYVRKRAAAAEVSALASQYQWRINKEQLARAVMTCESAALVLNEGVQTLFEDPHYERIFGKSAQSLLVRWWLLRCVDGVARGSGERQWAKHIVLQFLWDEIGGDIGRRQAAFIRACERGRRERAYSELERAVGHAMRGALQYYRAKRGKGAERIEVSPFFKRRDAYARFRTFWRSPQSSHRPRFVAAAKSFRSALASS